MAIVRRMLICAVGDMLPGSTRSFSYGPATKGIAYNREGVIKAYVNRCTHMGGPVTLHDDPSTSSGQVQVFRCGWHGADFDPCTGAAVSGQAPSGTFLKPIEVVEENGQLFAVLELPEDPFA